jgi:hypothetical protein
MLPIGIVEQACCQMAFANWQAHVDQACLLPPPCEKSHLLGLVGCGGITVESCLALSSSTADLSAGEAVARP